MKSLHQYITESEQWMVTPAPGDEFAINIREECLLESHITEVNARSIVIQGDDRLLALLEQYDMLGEEIRRYGAVGSAPGKGYTLEQQQGALPDEPAESRDAFRLTRMLELAGQKMQETAPQQPQGNAAHNDPLLGKAVDDAAVQPMEEGVMSEIDIDLRHIAKTGRTDALIDALRGEFGKNTAAYLQNMMSEIEQELEARGQQNLAADQDRMLDIMMDRIQDQYDDDDLEDDDLIPEAEYQGRKVELNKPMQGDVAKFKVYVKDPKTGNVKKVNFGDKTMRIKKSNPARRRSFRARHRCENPGPKTKARYWSCRKW